MSDSNLASLAYSGETTFGTPPTDGYKLLRMTGESIITEKEAITSDEIRSDRQIPDLAKVHNQASGSMDFELSVLQFDDLLQYAMQADYDTLDFTGAIAVVASSSTITGAAGDFSTVKVGSGIKVSGLADALNNGVKRVVAVSGDGSELTCVAGQFNSDESDTATIKVKSIRNGVTRKSMTIEKKIVDNTGGEFYQQFSGMVADTLSLNIESKAIITGSLSFLGLTGVKANTSIDSNGYANAPVGDILNGTSNMGTLAVDDAASTERFKTLTLEIANNLRGKDALSYEGNFDVGMGRCEITGSLNAYFKNNDFLTKVDDHDDISIDFTVTDSAGRTISVYLPRIKFPSGSASIEGIDSDVMVNTDIQAILDPVTGTQIVFDIFE